MNREKQKDKIIYDLKEENSVLRNMVGHLQDRINTFLAQIEIHKKNNRNVALSITEINRTLKVIKQAAVKEFAEKIKNLLLVTYGDHAPLGKTTGENIVCNIDKLLEEYTK